MNKKKVCIYIPTKNNNGFFDESVVNEVEKELQNDVTIEFMGNLNLEEASFVDGDVVCGDINISRCNLFFWYAKGMKRYEDILYAISSCVKTIKNPASLSIVGDKFKAHTTLKVAGFDVSQYALIKYDDIEMMEKVLHDWGTILIKPRMGSYGRGIIKVNNLELLRDIAGILELQTKNRYIFVERFYPHTMNDWVSIVVINFKAIYGYRKKDTKFADWKVYDMHKEGGNAIEADIEDVRDIAEGAAKAIGEQIICFDILKTEQGYKIIDENNFPGLYQDILTSHKTTIATVLASVVKSYCNSTSK